MPETQWHYSYYVLLVLIVTICFGLHRYFKRNGWL